MTAKKMSVERGMTTSVTGYGGGDDDPEEAKVNTVKTTRRRLGGGKDAAMAMAMAMGLGEELRPRSSTPYPPWPPGGKSSVRVKLRVGFRTVCTGVC